MNKPMYKIIILPRKNAISTILGIRPFQLETRFRDKLLEANIGRDFGALAGSRSLVILKIQNEQEVLPRYRGLHQIVLRLYSWHSYS